MAVAMARVRRAEDGLRASFRGNGDGGPHRVGKGWTKGVGAGPA